MSDWPIVVKKGRTNVGVVLVHDITGLDPVNLSFADRLQQEGFWVAAIDMFRGHQAKDLQEGMALRQKLTTEDLTQAMRFAHERLKAEIGPNAIVGSMGFCMGGGIALHGACHADYAFCIDWYGMINDVNDVAHLKGPLLLILASEDDRINPWAYAQLLPKLDEQKKRVHVELYPAVVHPFHRPDWITSPFSGVKSYDEKAANDAWAHSVAFIRGFQKP
ncbi:MAG: carboxymethylenebutenolidase [Thermoplasmata archaeon]|jgi:dienelactone hydrolase|nr:carboxymethylenebutenolidase [Thermoplasmata archaeon]